MSMSSGLNSVYSWLLWVMVCIGVPSLIIWIVERLFSKIKWIKFVYSLVMFIYLEPLLNPESGYLRFPSWLFLEFIFRKIIRQ